MKTYMQSFCTCIRHIAYIVVFVSILTSSFHKATASTPPFLNGVKKTASSPTVYYYQGSYSFVRYVFPNEKVFLSWYKDFSSIKTVAEDVHLASEPLMGNVKYRPGSTLVKITTDPKVYAVAKGGVLRWVKTEGVAAALYGPHWNKQVQDIPDSFFTDYVIGMPIASASDYSREQELAHARTIAENRGVSLTPDAVPPWPSTPTSITIPSIAPTPTTTSPTPTPTPPSPSPSPSPTPTSTPVPTSIPGALSARIETLGASTHISPYIYGIHHYIVLPTAEVSKATLVRMGGDDCTPYNLENTATNLGPHAPVNNNLSFDTQAGTPDTDQPGEAMVSRIKASHALGAAALIGTDPRLRRRR